MSGHLGVRHRSIEIDGTNIFYREAGPEHAPVILLPHGYPCSSFQFRNLMPALADRWRPIAPDYPGFGYSDTPEDFAYTLTAMLRCSTGLRCGSGFAAMRSTCTTTVPKSACASRSRHWIASPR